MERPLPTWFAQPSLWLPNDLNVRLTIPVSMGRPITVSASVEDLAGDLLYTEAAAHDPMLPWRFHQALGEAYRRGVTRASAEGPQPGT